MSLSIPASEIHIFHERRTPYALVVGVYNEGDKFTRQLDALQRWRGKVDIIIADGGSTDGATAQEALRHKVRTLIVNTDAQRGLSVQYRSALHFALSQDYQGVIMMDGNGKDGVDALPLFIEKLEQGVDFIQGSRFMPGGQHEHTPLDRVLGIRFVFNPIMNCGSKFHYTDAMNGFKGCSRRFLLDPRVQPFRSVFVRYNLQYYLNYSAPRLGFKVVEVPVLRRYTTEKMPQSKIIGLRARLKIMGELLNTVSGRYNI
jgi:dolichol-phosphate mannosyltransferase